MNKFILRAFDFVGAVMEAPFKIWPWIFFPFLGLTSIVVGGYLIYQRIGLAGLISIAFGASLIATPWAMRRR
jgi:hypothetical protein